MTDEKLDENKETIKRGATEKLEMMFKAAAENNESTSFPWWFIVDPKQNMSCDVATVAMNIVGPFFSRESAEDFLSATRYNFGKRAAVWCGSGTHSPEWRALFLLMSDKEVSK